MDVEKSRSGFYTVTFLNKNNLDEKEIHREFSTVGNVCKVVRNSHRIFIRFREKEEAERAILKYGTTYEVSMAKNRISDAQQSEVGFNNNSKPSSNHNQPLSASPEVLSSSQSMEKLNTGNKIFHLILANLPKNYTIKDVKALVEEVQPVCINQIDESRVFNIRFCHIALNSAESLSYLINKLNGFKISGETLLAVEAKHLVEWRDKAFTGQHDYALHKGI